MSDKRVVSLLSTCVDPESVTVIHSTKGGLVHLVIPKPITNYNDNMGGVDLADQHRSYYTIGRPGLKWWRYAMWFIFQVAIINSWLLMRKSNPTAGRDTPASKHLLFRKSLLKSLFSSGTKPKATPSMPSLAGQTPSNKEHDPIRMTGRKKRCYQCAQDNKKQPSGRTPETVYGCGLCKVYLHEGHCFSKFHNNLTL